MSEELHGDILTRLSSVIIDLGLLARLADTRSISEELDNLRVQVRNSELGLCGIVQRIFPSVLTNLSLVPVLRDQVQQLASRTVDGPHSMTVRFVATGYLERKIADGIAFTVYRVVQEAIANCLKHSGASNVDIQLHLGDRLLQLSIEDNGVGFDATCIRTGPAASRFGMTIVRDRLTLAGGELAVQSAPDRGTALSGRVPVYDNGKLGEGPKTQEIEISIPNQVRESDRAGQLS